MGIKGFYKIARDTPDTLGTLENLRYAKILF